jgi:hypothetical protein
MSKIFVDSIPLYNSTLNEPMRNLGDVRAKLQPPKTYGMRTKRVVGVWYPARGCLYDTNII